MRTCRPADLPTCSPVSAMHAARESSTSVNHPVFHMHSSTFAVSHDRMMLTSSVIIVLRHSHVLASAPRLIFEQKKNNNSTRSFFLTLHFSYEATCGQVLLPCFYNSLFFVCYTITILQTPALWCRVCANQVLNVHLTVHTVKTIINKYAVSSTPAQHNNRYSVGYTTPAPSWRLERHRLHLLLNQSSKR